MTGVNENSIKWLGRKVFTLEDVKNRILEDYYLVKLPLPKKPEGYKNENYVYDENKSVKWNREHQKELEEKYLEERHDYQLAANAKEEEFFLDVRKALHEEYGFTPKQSEIISSHIWNEYHSSGLIEVINQMSDFSEILADIIDAGDEDWINSLYQ